MELKEQNREKKRRSWTLQYGSSEENKRKYLKVPYRIGYHGERKGRIEQIVCFKWGHDKERELCENG